MPILLWERYIRSGRVRPYGEHGFRTAGISEYRTFSAWARLGSEVGSDWLRSGRPDGTQRRECRAPLQRERCTGSQGYSFTTTNAAGRSEEHTSELQSRGHLVCRLLLEKK